MIEPLTKRTMHPVPDVGLDTLDLSAREKAALVVFCWSESNGDLDALKASITTAIGDSVRRGQLQALEAVEQMVRPYYINARTARIAAQFESILASLVILQNQVSAGAEEGEK